MGLRRCMSAAESFYLRKQDIINVDDSKDCLVIFEDKRDNEEVDKWDIKRFDKKRVNRSLNGHAKITED